MLKRVAKYLKEMSVLVAIYFLFVGLFSSCVLAAVF